MFNTKTKTFFINKIFTFERGQRLIKQDQLEGKIPYVSSTMLNNGVDNLISEHSINRNTKRKPKVFENALTIANSGSVGSVFYHPYKFIASDHVTVLKLIDRDLDFKTAMFLKVLLEQKSSQYSYNREISNERMEAEKIILPVKENEEIDWEFMINFIDTETDIDKVIREYNNFKLKDIDAQIDTSNWDWWRVDQLFDLKRGKGIPKQDREVGSIPYISAKNNNNGLEQLISTPDCLYNNCLTWVNNGDGGVGFCFYHPYTFRPSSDVTVLVPKNFTLNEYTGLFFANVLTLERPKFSFAYKLTSDRITAYRVKFPTVVKNGVKSLDFKWIENFMKDLKDENKPL